MVADAGGVKGPLPSYRPRAEGCGVEPRFLPLGMLPTSNACVRDLEGVFVSAAASSGSVSMGATLNDVSSAAQQQWFSVLLSAGAWRAATAGVRASALAHKGQMCCKLWLQVPSARSARSRFRHVSEEMYRCLDRRSCDPCGLRTVFLLTGNGSGLLGRVFRLFERGERNSARTAVTETTSQ